MFYELLTTRIKNTKHFRSLRTKYTSSSFYKQKFKKINRILNNMKCSVQARERKSVNLVSVIADRGRCHTVLSIILEQ